MIVIMGAAAVTVMTMEVAVVRRIGVIVVGVAVAMVWNMCDVVEGTEKAVMVEVMGLFCRVCIPDPSCNNQRRKESKREKRLHFTLTSSALCRKPNFRNWPGQVGKEIWKVVICSPRPHPSPHL